MHIAFVYSKYQNVSQEKVAVNPNAPAVHKNTVTAIEEALVNIGHKVTKLEANQDLLNNLQQMEEPDLIINMSTGISDKRSQANIVGMLEMLNIPMLGSGLNTHVVALHKEMTKSMLIAHGIPTADYQLIADENDPIRDDLTFPLIVKPEHEGSAIGVTDSSKVDSPDKLREIIKEKLDVHQQVLLVEEFLPGREFTVGVIGNTELEVLPINETKFKKDGPQILTVDTEMGETFFSEIPANISEELADEIRELAKKTYRLLRCQDFARIDFRLDGEGRPHVIELNSFPGMEKGVSFFPLIAEAAGYTYEELLKRLVEVALEPRGYL